MLGALNPKKLKKDLFVLLVLIKMIIPIHHQKKSRLKPSAVPKNYSGNKDFCILILFCIGT